MSKHIDQPHTDVIHTDDTVPHVDTGGIHVDVNDEYGTHLDSWQKGPAHTDQAVQHTDQTTPTDHSDPA